jgi:hypothetical protein
VQAKTKGAAVPIQCFMAPSMAEGDKCRKPGTGMWDYMVEHCNDGIKPGGGCVLRQCRWGVCSTRALDSCITIHETRHCRHRGITKHRGITGCVCGGGGACGKPGTGVWGFKVYNCNDRITSGTQSCQQLRCGAGPVGGCAKLAIYSGGGGGPV